ncbi:MAG: hypothetical protein IJT65_05355 [Eubacterium sp.]|nr:hypothetical protein [Eubacterium sp.]
MKAKTIIKGTLVPLYIFLTYSFYKFTLVMYTFRQFAADINNANGFSYMYVEAVVFSVAFGLLAIILGVKNKYVSIVSLFVLSVVATILDTNFAVLFIPSLSAIWIIKNLYCDGYSYKKDCRFIIPVSILLGLSFTICYITLKTNTYRIVNLSTAVKKELLISVIISVFIVVLLNVLLLVLERLNNKAKNIIPTVIFALALVLIDFYCVITYIHISKLFITLYNVEKAYYNNIYIFALFIILPFGYAFYKFKNKSCKTD